VAADRGSIPPVRPASSTDLEGWDAAAVDAPGGHVYQSRAWARHRARFGWEPRFLVVGGGAPVLALTRPWRLVPGASAYVSRGPVPADDAGGEGDSRERLVAVARWLGENGVDVVAADPEVLASTGIAEGIGRVGFRQIDELQASRHRMDVSLAEHADAEALLKSYSATTRNLVRKAIKQDLRVRRIDRPRAAVPAGGGSPANDGGDGDGTPMAVPRDEERPTLARLYALLVETARRREFGLAGRPTFESWTTEALEAGHLLALLVEDADGELLAGATFHRHGRRLTYALSGEAASARRSYPGATRLLLWHAMGIAIAEGRAIMDLGGVDVRGARRRPRPEEPEHGMLTFKESFGAEWVELAGAHELVIRPARYAAGRLASRVLRAR
jgi:lipid II:glycine glycyltransferase (peptidoglycan interpeptide bridge formation enzyme)